MGENKLKFEFNFDEMISGIKFGVMKELTDITYDNIEKSVTEQVRSELLKRFDLDWSERLDLKREIKDEISKRVAITIKQDILNEIKSKHKAEFDNMIRSISIDSRQYKDELKNEVVTQTVDELYSSLIHKTQAQINKKVEQFTYQLMNNLGGNNVTIANNNGEKIITKEEYEKLIERDNILAALEQGGVDNWEWYGESLSQYFDDEE